MLIFNFNLHDSCSIPGRLFPVLAPVATPPLGLFPSFFRRFFGVPSCKSKSKIFIKFSVHKVHGGTADAQIILVGTVLRPGAFVERDPPSGRTFI
jgi:hypothetical protein